VVVAVLLPLTGLMLLLARPEFDMEWEHHPSHFWIVLGTAGVSVALAYVTNVAAGRYRDARLVLISLAFLASAGFLGLHALATPGVLLEQPNAGFVVATPAGLVLASIFAAASTTTLAGPRARTVLRARPLLLWSLIGLMFVWGFLSLARLPPLDGPPPAKEGVGPLQVLAIAAVALYIFAAWRSIALYGLRGGTVLLTIALALILLRPDRPRRTGGISTEWLAHRRVRRAVPRGDARPDRSLAGGGDRCGRRRRGSGWLGRPGTEPPQG
jgi:hypothetical protein